MNKMRRNKLDITRIRPDPTQPRVTFDPVAHGELTHSVKRLGLLQPITVRLLEKEDIKEFYLGLKDASIRGTRRWKKKKTWR